MAESVSLDVVSLQALQASDAPLQDFTKSQLVQSCIILKDFAEEQSKITGDISNKYQTLSIEHEYLRKGFSELQAELQVLKTKLSELQNKSASSNKAVDVSVLNEGDHSYAISSLQKHSISASKTLDESTLVLINRDKDETKASLPKPNKRLRVDKRPMSDDDIDLLNQSMEADTEDTDLASASINNEHINSEVFENNLTSIIPNYDVSFPVFMPGSPVNLGNSSNMEVSIRTGSKTCNSLQGTEPPSNQKEPSLKDRISTGPHIYPSSALTNFGVPNNLMKHISAVSTNVTETILPSPSDDEIMQIGTPSSKHHNANPIGVASQIHGPAPVHPSKTGGLPVITIFNVKNWNLLRSEIKKIIPGKFLARCSGAEVRITLYNDKDYRNMEKFLRDNALESVIYNINKDNNMRVIIKHIAEDIDIKEIKQELESFNLEIHKISRLRKSKENNGCSLVLVSLPNSGNNKAIWEIKELAGLAIRIEAYKQPKPFIIQCYNCQGFGHGSSSCLLQTKCVRCGTNHSSASCPKKGRKDITCKCANCGGPHPASFRDCPRFPKFPVSTAFPQYNSTPFSQGPSLSAVHTPTHPSKLALPSRSYSQVTANSSGPSIAHSSISEISKMFHSMQLQHAIMMEAMQKLLSQIQRPGQ